MLIFRRDMPKQEREKNGDKKKQNKKNEKKNEQMTL